MTRPLIHRAFALVALLLAVSACGDSRASRGADQLARSTFIETYLDLRVSALRSDDGQITDSARAEILRRHGVTEEELVDFVTATAADLDFTRDLWNEIELRLDSVPPLPRNSAPADSAAVDSLAGPSSSNATGAESHHRIAEHMPLFVGAGRS